jgi:hypothetical protein
LGTYWKNKFEKRTSRLWSLYLSTFLITTLDSESSRLEGESILSTVGTFTLEYIVEHEAKTMKATGVIGLCILFVQTDVSEKISLHLVL